MHLMKKLFPQFVAGVVGGIVVLGAFLLLKPNVYQLPNTPNTAFQVKQFSYSGMPTDFALAAEVSMPAVVHITASESEDLASRRYEEQRRSYRRDPFSFFFGEDFFNDWPLFDAPRRQSGKGSGVIVSSDGYIVTNNHVIDFADNFEVTLNDNRKFKAHLIGKDARTDIAVIKIDAQDLPTLKIGSSEEARIGDWVLAVGNPFDLTSTVTAGIVSAKGRNNILHNNNAIEDFIQTDAAVNPGNSGGALVNLRGELIGINTAIASPNGVYAGYAFAVPAHIVKTVMDNIIEFGGARPQLGVNIADLKDFEDYEEVDLPADKGIVITDIEDGSAAQYAGLLPQDVILEADGIIMEKAEDLQEIINEKKIGDQIELKIDRNGEIKYLSVRLKS